MKKQSLVVEHPSGEPDLAPLMCIYCGLEIDAEGEPWPQTCPNCGHSIDLQTQFAFIRGRDAFIAGQDILMQISPRKRRKSLTSAEEMEGLQYYNQAYTSMQLAFQGTLAESQRRLAIEIMAAIALVFRQHDTISILEAGYWTTLMLELTTQLERAQVLKKLERLPPGLRGFLPRLRWRLRLGQLERALAQQDERIRSLERQIRFVSPPRARRKTLPPL